MQGFSFMMRASWVFLLLLASFEPATAQSPETGDFVPDEVIVKFIGGTIPTATRRTSNGVDLELIKELPLSGALQMRILSGQTVAEAVGLLSAEPDVEYAQPNHIYRITGHLREPNDPSFSIQWGLNNRGISGPGIPVGTIDADIDAPQAWEHLYDCSSVIVAVIDTGADLTHADLAGNLWTNPGELGGNGLDDDGNGFVDDVHGADWVNTDGDPTDDQGHGTAISGIIGAIGDNATDTSGVCWKARLMIVKTIAANGDGNGADLEAGMDYAIANGAKVINLSLGTYVPVPPQMSAAIGAADRAGILIVTGAGNESINNDAPPMGPPANGNSLKPCSLVNPNIICVAASDNRDAPDISTNWGLTTVDLFAPGRDMVMLRNGGGVFILNGQSSAATAFVTGAAAHCWSLFPDETHLEIKARILDGVDSRPNLKQARPVGGPTQVLSGLGNDGRLRMCMGDDFGDAPDPVAGAGKYPTLLASNGARHRDVGEEWLGDGPPFYGLGSLEVSPEFDADVLFPLDADGGPNLVDHDRAVPRIGPGVTSNLDDGVRILGPTLLPFVPQPVGLVLFQVCTENHQVIDNEGGRYVGGPSPALGDPALRLVADKALFVNGFFDWNKDGDFDDDLEYAFSRRFQPPAPVAGMTGSPTCHGYVPQVFLAPKNLAAGDLWARFRLDYGEDARHGGAGNKPVFEVGHTGPPAPRYDTSTSYNRSRGQAQFGEVEDYVREVDRFSDTKARLGIQTPYGSETLTLSGPTTVVVDIGNVTDPDQNGREQVQTEMIELDLTGESALLGPVKVRLRDPEKSPFLRSRGEIEESDNKTAGVLDLPPFASQGSATSFFDVLVEITLAEGTVLHNETPIRLVAEITHKPPAEGESYRGTGTPVLVFDEENRPVAGTTIVHVDHTPEPVPIRDCNKNGVDDREDIANGTSQDVDHDGRPDECQIFTVSCLVTGTANGGTVTVDVDGFYNACTVVTVTTAGETAAMVVANVVAALNADVCLSSQGIFSAASGSVLRVTGFNLGSTSLTIATTDTGLELPRPVTKVATLSAAGLWLMIVTFLTLGIALIRRRSGWV